MCRDGEGDGHGHDDDEDGTELELEATVTKRGARGSTTQHYAALHRGYPPLPHYSTAQHCRSATQCCPATPGFADLMALALVFLFNTGTTRYIKQWFWTFHLVPPSIRDGPTRFAERKCTFGT
ncbi:hypothetical protein DFH09DRAFT_1071548 [Mycena vulgaris]|nr:hypothetical protein DFH09DRAFT_1071548 [Mycena vulgaris]